MIALAPKTTSGQSASVPDIIASNDYESPALFWLYREIKRLDESMRAVGLADEDARRNICERFFFGTEEGLTQPVKTMDDENYTPKLVLIGADDRILHATSMFDFQEYAHAIVAEYFENPHPE